MNNIVCLVIFLVFVSSCQGTVTVAEVEDKANNTSIDPMTSEQAQSATDETVNQTLDDNKMADTTTTTTATTTTTTTTTTASVGIVEDTSLEPVSSEQALGTTLERVDQAFDLNENSMEHGMKSNEDHVLVIDAGIDLQLTFSTSGNVGDRNNTAVTRTEARIQSIQNKMENFSAAVSAKIDSLGNILGVKLAALDKRITDIYNDNKVKKIEQLKQFRKYLKSKAETFRYFKASALRSGEGQRQVLENAVRKMNQTSNHLSFIENEFDSFKNFAEFQLKNQTERLSDLFTAGRNSNNCLQHDSDATNATEYLRPICYRGMAVSGKKYEPLEIMYDARIGREILCDTQTDGGGWIVIQRRTKGDENFDRKWLPYKNGFGNMTGDFWFGNEAVHNLTSTGIYELRILLKLDTRNYSARYFKFKIGNESDWYRLTIGNHSEIPPDGLPEKSTFGLSHSNGSRFSTSDNDNDGAPVSCADRILAGWWFKKPCRRNCLNALWKTETKKGVRWHTGDIYLYPLETEMKIRRL